MLNQHWFLDPRFRGDDKFKPHKAKKHVIPAQAGIQWILKFCFLLQFQLWK